MAPPDVAACTFGSVEGGQEPLRKIHAFGGVLEEDCADALTDLGRDYLSRIQNAAARMKTLVNDLLTLSRITTEAQPFVPVDLGEDGYRFDPHLLTSADDPDRYLPSISYENFFKHFIFL